MRTRGLAIVDAYPAAPVRPESDSLLPNDGDALGHESGRMPLHASSDEHEGCADAVGPPAIGGEHSRAIARIADRHHAAPDWIEPADDWPIRPAGLQPTSLDQREPAS